MTGRVGSFIALLALTEACNPTHSESRAPTVLWLENDILQLRFEASHGTLIGLKNKVSGTEMLAGNSHANFNISIDRSTSDLWRAHGELVRGRDARLSRFEVGSVPGGTKLDLVFDDVGGPGVRLTQHVVLLDRDPVSRWTTEVTVDSGATATVTSVASPQVTGLSKLPDEQLLWPWEEGVLYPDPGSTLHTMQYPVPASMQWMELFNNREGIYFATLDSTAGYKEFRFGHDATLDPSDEKPRQMSITLYPFVTSGHTFTSPVTELGILQSGGWYEGADRYRSWLKDAGWVKVHPPIATELTAWRNGANKTKSGAVYTYCDIPKVLLSRDYSNETGIHVLELRRWNDGGLDTFYPDYDFLSSGSSGVTCLESTDLGNAITTLHQSNSQILFYLNSRIADVESRWYSRESQGTRSAVKAIDGSMYQERYSGRTFEVMCPMSKEWISQLAGKALELRDIAGPGAGADGIWWDQLEEADSALCYDRDHGHSSPATAFSDGHAKMMQHAHDLVSHHGANTNYLFAGEGVNDAHARFIDVSGMMWGRKLGYRCAWTCETTPACVGGWPCGDPIHAPEITRYTLSSKFLGIHDVNTAPGDVDEYASAFLMGEPLMAPDYPEPANLHAFPRYLNIYRAAPEIYFRGEYKHSRGLSLEGDGPMRGSVIVGEGGAALGVQVHATSGTAVSFSVGIALGALGFPGKRVVSVTDIETGIPFDWAVDGESVRFRGLVPARDVKAFKVSLGSL